jgi:hypothetical protein
MAKMHDTLYQGIATPWSATNTSTRPSNCHTQQELPMSLKIGATRFVELCTQGKNCHG